MPIIKVPFHLGIILDGNRRWAKKNGLPSFEGHRRGLNNVHKIGDYCAEKGIKILTLYTFYMTYSLLGVVVGDTL